jgi:hypothetical protein
MRILDSQPIKMKFVTAVILLFLLVALVTATRTDCNAETSVLSVGEPTNSDRCDAKKICTLKCNCGKVAFFDLTSTQFEGRYQISCLVPRFREAGQLTARLISSQETERNKEVVTAFGLAVHELLAKGLTSLGRLQSELNSFKTKNDIDDVDSIAQMEMLIVNIARIFEKKCECEGFVSGVGKDFKRKQCSKLCGRSEPKDPEDDDDDYDEEEEKDVCPAPRRWFKGDCVCKRGDVWNGKTCVRDEEDDDEDDHHHDREDDDEGDRDDREEEDDDREEKEDEQEENDDTPKKPKRPKQPKTPKTPKTPKKPKTPKRPREPVPPVVPQLPDEEITNIRTEIKVLMPEYKACVQRKTQCCAQASPCCGQELTHSSGESYRTIFRRLARKTRKTLRNIERRGEQRRLHARTRGVARRIFSELAAQLKTL